MCHNIVDFQEWILRKRITQYATFRWLEFVCETVYARARVCVCICVAIVKKRYSIFGCGIFLFYAHFISGSLLIAARTHPFEWAKHKFYEKFWLFLCIFFRMFPFRFSMRVLSRFILSLNLYSISFECIFFSLHFIWFIRGFFSDACNVNCLQQNLKPCFFFP